MRRFTRILPLAALVAAGLGTVTATAHECDDVNDPSTCRDTEVAPNWRDGNYIPLFDLEDREDPEQRKAAQRWREECESGAPTDPDYESRQLCAWAYGGSSFFPDRDDPSSLAPNEVHAGFAASHCFLQEFAHQCEDHESSRGEGVHDGHGGATYVDVCLTENDESKFCDDGMKDTQVGLTVMDHNPCGLVVPIVACIDEYHVIRPFDQEYTAEQMEDSAEYIPRILADPELYLCGYPQYRDGLPICPGEEQEGTGDGASRALSVPPRDTLGARADGVVGVGASAPSDAAWSIAHTRALGLASGATAGSTGAGDAGAWWTLAFVLAAGVARRASSGRRAAAP